MFKLNATLLATSIVFISALLLGSFLYHRGKTACTTQILQSEIQAHEAHIKLENEIKRLPPSQLKRRYCQWVRDDKDQCLQADLPLP